MKPFPLTIVTPDGVLLDGEAEELILRTASGEMGVMAGHENIVCPLGMGRAVVTTDGQKRAAACIGGMLSVLGGCTHLVATTFEWQDQIDLKHAEDAEKRAREELTKAQSENDKKVAEAKLKRALVRQSVAKMGVK